MGQQSKNVPTLSTYDELVKAGRVWECCKIDATKQIPEQLCLLEYNEVPILTLGGIQAITGHKKNGKSWVNIILAAILLGDGSDRILKYFPGWRIPDRTKQFWGSGHKPSVLYIDTEQEEINSVKILRRIHWLCGWDMNKPNDQFTLLWLRNVEKDDVTREPAHVRMFKIIKSAMADIKPDFVIIDGIRDIIGNFNDLEGSSELIRELMALAQKNNICIVNTLHYNPRPGNDEDSKMRGHLGTELGNKVSDTLACFKKKTSTGVTFTVKQVDARGKDMDDWVFEVTDDAGNLGIPKIISNSADVNAKPKHDSKDDIISWLSRSCDIGGSQWPLSRNEVKDLIFHKIGGVKSSNRQQADIVFAIEQGILIETAMKKGGHPMLAISEDIPF